MLEDRASPAGSDAFMLFFCSVYLITSIRDL